MPVSADILCIGHAVHDLCLHVDGFPAENLKCETQDLFESGGGPAANAAYLLSSWGHRCAFAGLIGDDDHGRRIKGEFEAAGTDVSLLELRPGHATPFSVILVNKQTGSRTVINRKIKDRFLQLTEASLRSFAPRFLLFDGHELPASLAALRAFPEAVSILDAGSWREGTAELAGKVDYLAASERFALQATGLPGLVVNASHRRCVEALREKYGVSIVVTLGEKGLVADDGHGFFSMPAFSASVVDTTGAGDIFHGAFVHALALAMPFRDCLGFASMAAALSVSARGGRQSMPALKAVNSAWSRAKLENR